MNPTEWILMVFSWVSITALLVLCMSRVLRPRGPADRRSPPDTGDSLA